MTRTARYRGQLVARVTASKPAARWDVFDVNGFQFASCPFQLAVVPLTSVYQVTVTPNASMWSMLNETQRDLIDLIELCICLAPIPAAWVEGSLYHVMPDSPWYIAPPELSPALTRPRRKLKQIEPEETIIAPLTQRRFSREDD